MTSVVNTELGSSRDAAQNRDLRILASPLLGVALIAVAIAQQASGHIDSDVSWFLTLAEKQGAPVPLMVGHRLMGVSLMFTGSLVESRDHFDRASPVDLHPSRK